MRENRRNGASYGNGAVAPASNGHDAGEKADHAAHIQTILDRCVPAVGTLVETYLNARGLDLPDCPDLMRHPALMDWSVRQRRPAMVALVRKPDTGEWTGGIHRTYLAEDGGDKAEPKSPR